MESVKLTTVKDDNLISGLAKLLRDKIISEKATWDITVAAVEHLDNITDSSIGLVYGILCLIEPKPDSVITLGSVESMSKDSLIEENGLKNLFELYDKMNKNGSIDNLFKR